MDLGRGARGQRGLRPHCEKGDDMIPLFILIATVAAQPFSEETYTKEWVVSKCDACERECTGIWSAAKAVNQDERGGNASQKYAALIVSECERTNAIIHTLKANPRSLAAANKFQLVCLVLSARCLGLNLARPRTAADADAFERASSRSKSFDAVSTSLLWYCGVLVQTAESLATKEVPDWAARIESQMRSLKVED
jgi:hypothetical protein